MSDQNQPLEEGETQIDKNATTQEALENKTEALEHAPVEQVTASKAETTEVKAVVPMKDLAATEEVIEEEEVESSDTIEETEISKESVDYSSLTKIELITAIENLIANNNIQSIKEEAEEIKTEFNNQFQEELTEKKTAFLAEGGNIIDFHYASPEKKAFNDVFNDYRTKRNSHFKKLKQDLEGNLDARNLLIEEVKTLLNSKESVNSNYKKIKDIQDRWKQAGAIPRDKYNTVWNNYHHYMETYYDALQLDREFRDLDFKHNLEEKQKLIKRTEALAEETNIDKAFRELQLIHRRWKEEIGPVAREIREEIWETFSAATKIIHDKKMLAEAALEETFKENFAIKKELIGLIDKVKEEAKPSHNGWQNAMKQVQEIRDVFFTAGRVPKDKNKEIWATFKDTTRNFNKAKNDFYKLQKSAQYDNLEKKRKLIKLAEDNKDTEDFEKTTPLFKKIQHDWREIGHVPRKDSDVIWKQFKSACNHYFDRLHALKDEENKEELVNLEKKQAILAAMGAIVLSGDHKEDIQAIKAKITDWKSVGRVPFKKKNIDQKFNKALDALFGSLDLDKKEAELIKFENKLNAMASQDDDRKLQNEQFFIGKKIDETKSEILQLENNLQFFKHVKKDNPLVKEVYKNIENHKEQLALWKEKLIKIKAIRVD
tara:strand:+ start:72911 stop:74884 length:1974 start_codon:yes stop_codon:yes gene_type:complete